MICPPPLPSSPRTSLPKTKQLLDRDGVDRWGSLLLFWFCARCIDAKIPDVAANAVGSHFDEGVFAGREALVEGIAEDAGGRSPGLDFDVADFVFFLACEFDADGVDEAVAAFYLRAKQTEAWLAAVHGAHKEFRL